MSQTEAERVLEAIGSIGEYRLTDGPHCRIDGKVYEMIDCQAIYRSTQVDSIAFSGRMPAAISESRQLEVTLKVAISHIDNAYKSVVMGSVPIKIVPKGYDGVTTIYFDGIVTQAQVSGSVLTMEIVSTGQPRCVIER